MTRDHKDARPPEIREPFIEAARGYAELGLFVFPVYTVREDGRCSCGDSSCERIGKHPDTPHGFKDATTDLDRIEIWGRRSPEANIGIATEESDLIVVDADCKHGSLGLKNWARIVAELGPECEDTAMVRTQSGGLHLLYRVNGLDVASSVGSVAPGIDIRALGGYIVAPPSVGVDGTYQWVEGHGLDHLRDLPPALAKRLVPAEAADPEPAPSGETIPQGTRNKTLASLGGSMRQRGMTESEILAALLIANAKRCEPPLSEDEVRRIAASLASYAPAVSGEALITCLDDVEPEEVVFLWDGRLVQGKLNLIFGEPGLGKSYLTLYCAANVSRGLPWPDGGAPPVGTVILLTAEDGLADTIRPRLDKLGADPTRIHALTAVRRGKDGHEASFSLLDDLALLEAAVVRLSASLVIIDPLNAYLQKVDSHRASEVRSALAPIAAMAERTHVTFLAVHHTNKSGDGRALNRVTGSGDFAAAPRSVLLVAPDPADESRRCLVSAKLNLAVKPPGLGFSIIEGGLVFDDEPVTQDANALLAAFQPGDKAGGKFEEAKTWLADYLGDNEEHAQKEVAAAAKRAGIADSTLWRAKKALQVDSAKDGMTTGWTWRLPSPIANVRIHRKVINSWKKEDP